MSKTLDAYLQMGSVWLSLVSFPVELIVSRRRDSVLDVEGGTLRGWRSVAGGSHWCHFTAKTQLYSDKTTAEPCHLKRLFPHVAGFCPKRSIYVFLRTTVAHHHPHVASFFTYDMS